MPASERSMVKPREARRSQRVGGELEQLEIAAVARHAAELDADLRDLPMLFARARAAAHDRALVARRYGGAWSRRRVATMRAICGVMSGRSTATSPDSGSMKRSTSDGGGRAEPALEHLASSNTGGVTSR